MGHEFMNGLIITYGRRCTNEISEVSSSCDSCTFPLFCKIMRKNLPLFHWAKAASLASGIEATDERYLFCRLIVPFAKFNSMP